MKIFLEIFSVEKDVVIEGFAESIEGKHGNLLVTSVKKTTYSSHVSFFEKFPKHIHFINKLLILFKIIQNRYSNPEFPEQKSLVNPSGLNGPGPLAKQQYSTSNIELVNSFASSSPSPIEDSRASGSSEKENDSKNQMLNGQSQVGLRAGVKRSTSKAQRPLTRYLPILSSDLNLRQHIETAGHQLQLCPHVIINETSCRGYLNKMGAKFGGWSKRWFVFDRDRTVMLYFSDKSEKKPRGGAYFAVSYCYLFCLIIFFVFFFHQNFVFHFLPIKFDLDFE